MAILVDIQRAWTLQETPGAASIESWVNAALGNRTVHLSSIFELLINKKVPN